MKNIAAVFILFLSTLTRAQEIKIDKELFHFGDRIHFFSDVLDEERVLNVYLPVGYHKDSLINYPVIYVLDGSKDEDFIHIAGLTQFLSYPWINAMTPAIVVGVENVDRIRDFTYPSSDTAYTNAYPMSGHSATFIRFLRSEVKSIINQNYSVNQNQEILLGQSLGGLLATEILLNYPKVYDQYVIVSPSLWYDNESLLDLEEANFNVVAPVFIAVGAEGRIMKSVAKKLYKKLKKKSHQIYFEYFPNHSHGDVLHLAAYKAFSTLNIH